jgi:hypothetical protein
MRQRFLRRRSTCCLPVSMPASQRSNTHALCIYRTQTLSSSWSADQSTDFPANMPLLCKQSVLHPRTESHAPISLLPVMCSRRSDIHCCDLVWIGGREFGFAPEISGGSALVLSRAGGLLDDALDKAFQDELFDWIGKTGLGFFYDCLNPNPSNGGLLHKDWKTIRAMKMVLLHGVIGTSLSRCACCPYSRTHQGFGSPRLSGSQSIMR